jgi:hypothetical protein
MATTRKHTGVSPRPRKPDRSRNYRAEYQRRKQRGLAKGLSLSQARGHARAGERLKPANRLFVDRNSPEEKAIRAMQFGIPLRRSAKTYGLSEQHLRRYAKENAGGRFVGRRWVFDDQRPRRVPAYSEGELKALVLTPYEASRAGSFMQSVRQFLPTGDLSILAPYVGQGVTDVAGRFHPFETDPNRLYELDSAGELNFPEFYRIIN